MTLDLEVAAIKRALADTGGGSGALSFVTDFPAADDAQDSRLYVRGREVKRRVTVGEPESYRFQVYNTNSHITALGTYKGIFTDVVDFPSASNTEAEHLWYIELDNANVRLYHSITGSTDWNLWGSSTNPNDGEATEYRRFNDVSGTADIAILANGQATDEDAWSVFEEIGATLIDALQSGAILRLLYVQTTDPLHVRFIDAGDYQASTEENELESIGAVYDVDYLPQADELNEGNIFRLNGKSLWAIDKETIEVETAGRPLLASVLVETGVSTAFKGFRAPEYNSTYTPRGQATSSPIFKYGAAWDEVEEIAPAQKILALEVTDSRTFVMVPLGGDGDDYRPGAPTLDEWVAAWRGPGTALNDPDGNVDVLLYVKNLTDNQVYVWDMSGCAFTAKRQANGFPAGEAVFQFTMLNGDIVAALSDIDTQAGIYAAISSGDDLEAWFITKKDANTLPTATEIAGSSRAATWTEFTDTDFLGAVYTAPASTHANLGKHYLNLHDEHFYVLTRASTHGRLEWFPDDPAQIFPEHNARWIGVFADEADADLAAERVNDYVSYGGKVYRCSAFTEGYPTEIIRRWVRLDAPRNNPTVYLYRRAGLHTSRQPLGVTTFTTTNYPQLSGNNANVGATNYNTSGYSLDFRDSVDEEYYGGNEEIGLDVHAAAALSNADLTLGAGGGFSLPVGIYDLTLYFIHGNTSGQGRVTLYEIQSGTDDVEHFDVVSGSSDANKFFLIPDFEVSNAADIFYFWFRTNQDTGAASWHLRIEKKA